MVVAQPSPFSDSLPALVGPHAAVTFYVEGKEIVDRCAERQLKAR
jgi:hypothetical protein